MNVELHAGEERCDDTPGTLGAILYTDKSKTRPSESEWVALVHAIADGDQLSLRALYERSHRAVFTLSMRVTNDAQTAEELTVDVFHDVWRRAPNYDPANGTVLGWIMNQARSRAIDRVRHDQRKKRVNPLANEGTEVVEGDSARGIELSERDRALREALSTLTADERRAIETTYFADLTYAEAAARLEQPLGTVKTRIRSGLGKLREALTASKEHEP